ncbi:MAG: hypothetical protein E7578_01325 [Ruminococcaceae bacterium]|nr:hypothetical protein [Oscillospiraceae bacterium]
MKVAIVDRHGVKQHEDIELESEINLYGSDFNYQTAGNHGTSCAGIVGATQNNGKWVAGICKNISIISIIPPKLSYNVNDPSDSNIVSFFTDIVKCLNDHNISVANISFCIEEQYVYANKTSCENIINNYRGLLICSAGNKNFDVDDEPLFLSSFNCNNIISVGATNSSDELWYKNKQSGTNYGIKSVDLFAPGHGLSVIIGSGSSSDIELDAYGTSYAAPIVSGVAALIMSENPSLDPLQVKAIIMNTVDRSDAFIGKCVSGGRINAYRAVYVAHDLKDNAPDTESRYNSNFLFHASTNTIVKYVGIHGTPDMPSEINEVPVTKIEERAFYKNTFIRQIDIPSNITRIGEEAFRQCTALETVTVGSSIIQDRAFLGCNSLENVTLSNNLVGIGEMAFWDCNYEYISVPNTLVAIGDDAFALSSHLIVPEGSDVQNYFASKGYSMLLITGGSVSGYHNGTFVYVDPDNPGGLKNINIPESYLGTPITYIGSHAFEDADNIEMINIPTTVTSIGYRAFRGCDNLKTVVIPPSVTSISNSMNSTIVEDSPNATIYCTRASSAYGHVLQNNLSCIHMETRTNDAGDEYAVVCGLLEKEGNGTEYIIPETFAGLTVTMIDPAAFSCSMETPFNMTKMFIPETVETIGGNAFSDCTNLTDVYIYSDTATVGLYCFAGVDTSHFKIHCKSGSPAFVYAAINGYTFVLM